MEDGQYVDGSVWFYAPNKGAPIFFAVAYLATGAVHFWQAVPLYELANYYVLGRVLYFVPYYSPIHPGRVLTTFAAISMIVEILNGIGASYIANQTLPQDVRERGYSLLKAALIMQFAVVSLFLVLAATFQRKCRRNGINHVKVNRPLLTLYISSAIIMVRCVYRTIEFFDIADANLSSSEFDPSTISPVVRYEWFFYVFEATLMLCNSVLLNVRHPRRWLPKSTKVYLAKDGVTEITGPGYKQERNFVASLFDPFDLYGMIKGRDKTTRFWEETSTVGETKADVDAPGRTNGSDQV
ncbi:blue light receptor [Hypoxylon texense]